VKGKASFSVGSVWYYSTFH